MKQKETGSEDIKTDGMGALSHMQTNVIVDSLNNNYHYGYANPNKKKMNYCPNFFNLNLRGKYSAQHKICQMTQSTIFIF